MSHFWISNYKVHIKLTGSHLSTSLWIKTFLGIEKFEEFMLTLVLRKFSVEGNITSKEIMDYQII